MLYNTNTNFPPLAVWCRGLGGDNVINIKQIPPLSCLGHGFAVKCINHDINIILNIRP